MESRKIINDGQAEARSGNLFVSTHATADHGLPLIGGKPRAIVIDHYSDRDPIAQYIQLPSISCRSCASPRKLSDAGKSRMVSSICRSA